MAQNFLTPIDLNKLELLNAAKQNLPAPPASPTVGLEYFDTTLGYTRVWDGLTWQRSSGVDGSSTMPEASDAGVGSPGTSDEVSRADHKHPVSTATPGTAVPGDSASEGVSTSLARADHKHALPPWGSATSTSASGPGDPALGGVANEFARADHQHEREQFGTPTAEQEFGLASTPGIADEVSRADHTHGTPAHDAADHALIPLSALAEPEADLDLAGFRLQSVGEPTNDSDAATKQYVDGNSQGLQLKGASRVATTGTNIVLAGFQTIDGVLLTTGDRVLIKDQANAADNGIYVVSAGAWPRASDMDQAPEFVKAYTFVEEGTTNGASGWVTSTSEQPTVGVTAIHWVQFSQAGTVTAGDGLTKTGNRLDVGAGDGVVVGPDTIAVDLANTTPLAGGTAGSGSSTKVARADHVHPSDPTRTTKHSETLLGNAATTTYTVTHNLGTRDVAVAVREELPPYEAVFVGVEMTSVNAVTIRFAVAPLVGETYRVTVVG